MPHEVTHTIFATHFGCPLPRWADEGACTTVEHQEERQKQQQWLVRFLKTERGIPFNRMFAMTEYPGDILPLYSQGYSLARFLIAQGGRPKFIRFVGHGLNTGHWPAAVQQYYGFESLGRLQLTWVEWVKKGSPDDLQVASAPVQLASAASAGGSTAPPPPAASVSRGKRPLIDESLAPPSPFGTGHVECVGRPTCRTELVRASPDRFRRAGPFGSLHFEPKPFQTERSVNRNRVR